MKESCLRCGREMKLVREMFKGIECEAYRCPRCKTSLFTEEQALAFGRQHQQKLLKEKYTKRPVKVGNSYGLIFPRDVVRIFNLDSKNVRLDIRADRAKSKIEITVL